MGDLPNFDPEKEFKNRYDRNDFTASGQFSFTDTVEKWGLTVPEDPKTVHLQPCIELYIYF